MATEISNDEEDLNDDVEGDVRRLKSRIPIDAAKVAMRLYILLGLLGITGLGIYFVTSIAFPAFSFGDMETAIFFRENYFEILIILIGLGAGSTFAYLSPRIRRQVSIALLSLVRPDQAEPEEEVPLKRPPRDNSRNVIASLRKELTELKRQLSAVHEGYFEEYNKNRLITHIEALSNQNAVVVLFNAFMKRMNEERDRLRSNSRANLIWGIIFAGIALGILGYPLVVEYSYEAKSTLSLFSHFLPRTSLGVLLAVISFFFLRIYAAIEQDLKHNKNEITNIEARIMALSVSMAAKDSQSLREVVKSFAMTERNFILKKNEHTVASEVDNKYNDMKELTTDVLKLFVLSRDREKGAS